MVVSYFKNKKLHFLCIHFLIGNEYPNWIEVDSEQYTPFLLSKKQFFDTIAW